MNAWKVHLKFFDETNTEQELKLFDVNSYFGGYLKLKRSYFDALIKNVKMTKKNYMTGRAIEKVLGPDNEDWTHNPWMLIIVKDNVKNKPFWFFIKRERDLSGLLVAIGPKSFEEYSSNNPSEARNEIKRLMNYINAFINKFNCVILLPNYLQ